METHANNNKGFLQRLDSCVERVGGKRALATATLISEAQLFRYLGGDSILPTDRLMSIAKAANVDAGWLLTGLGNADGTATPELRPSFRPELLIQITQVFEELLLEYEKPFTPRQRARAIAFMYDALRHEELMRGNGIKLNPHKFDMLKYVSFLAELRTEEELEILLNSMNLLEYSTKNTEMLDDTSLQLLRTWCNLLVRGMKGYYSSYPGQVYFERMSGNLDPEAIQYLQNLVAEISKITRKTSFDWLDLGCGNGRHIAHLHKHMPNIRVKGLELSQLGFEACKDLMRSEKLPVGSVEQGDMRQLPYAAAHFDVVFAHMSLHSLPYLPGTGLGLEQAMDEIARVLRPGGIAVVVFPHGNWRDYSMPREFMNTAKLKKLVQDRPFELLSSIEKSGTDGNPKDNNSMPDHIKFLYKETLWGILQKK